MNRKIFTVFAIIIGSVALIAAGFFVVDKVANQKDLTDFLPPQTVAYLELAPNDVSLLNYFVANFRGQVQLTKFWQKINLWGGIDSKKAAGKIEKIGLVIRKKDDGEWQKVWLVKAKSNDIEVLLPANVFAASLGKNIFIFGPEMVEITDFQQTLETTAKRTIKNKFSRQKFFNVYLGEEFLTAATNDDLFPTPPLLRGGGNNADIELLRQLAISPEAPVIFGLRSDGQMIFLSANWASEEQKEGRALAASDYELIKNLPLKSLSWALETASLKEMLALMEEKMVAEVGAEKVAAQKKFWSEKYNFRWKELINFFDWPMVWWQEQKSEPEDAQLVAWPTGVAIKVKKQNKIAETYQQIKNFLSAVAAFMEPSVEKIKLPDGSEINILVADPEKVKWQTEAGGEFFKSSELSWALAQRGEEIYWTREIEALKRVLAKQEENDKIKTCPDYSGEEAIYLNGRATDGQLLSLFDEIFLVREREGKEVNMKGCLIW
jgi:hypothetical protein